LPCAAGVTIHFLIGGGVKNPSAGEDDPLNEAPSGTAESAEGIRARPVDRGRRNADELPHVQVRVCLVVSDHEEDVGARVVKSRGVDQPTIVESGGAGKRAPGETV